MLNFVMLTAKRSQKSNCVFPSSVPNQRPSKQALCQIPEVNVTNASQLGRFVHFLYIISEC